MQKILFFLVQLALPLWVAGQIQSLNGIWQFKTDPYKQGIQQQWYATDHDSACWAKHSVPGNWDLKNEQEEDTVQYSDQTHLLFATEEY